METKLIVCIRSPLQMDKRREAIRKTWGKSFVEHGAEVLFIVSGKDEQSDFRLSEDVLFTPGTNSHRDLTNRMCWLWKFLVERSASINPLTSQPSLSFTHALIIDDDCSVNVPFFMTLPWKEADAWGHNSGGYLSGCAAVYSYNAIEKLNYNMPKDDVVIGALLTRLKIDLTHAGNPCPIRPWGIGPKNKNNFFGDSEVAILHYVRTPEEILRNHKKL